MIGDDQTPGEGADDRTECDSHRDDTVRHPATMRLDVARDDFRRTGKGDALAQPKEQPKHNQGRQ